MRLILCWVRPSSCPGAQYQASAACAHMHGACRHFCMLLLLTVLGHKRIPCTAGLPLLQFQQFHDAKQLPLQETHQALLDVEVRHSWLANLTARSYMYLAP